MNDSRAASELEFLMRRGLLHPPMLCFKWPGATPLIIPEPENVSAYRSHLYLRHGVWPAGNRTLSRLAKEHTEIHDDPLFGYILLPGDIVHVHESDSTDDELPEWEW